MTLLRAFLVVALLALWGCATHYHYYDQRGGSVIVYLKHEDAREVYFLSSLDRFQPRPARRIKDDVWVNRVAAGVEFRYFYLIDNEVFLPECKYKENDDFGAANCIFAPDM